MCLRVPRLVLALLLSLGCGGGASQIRGDAGGPAGDNGSAYPEGGSGFGDSALSPLATELAAFALAAARDEELPSLSVRTEQDEAGPSASFESTHPTGSLRAVAVVARIDVRRGDATGWVRLGLLVASRGMGILELAPRGVRPDAPSSALAGLGDFGAAASVVMASAATGEIGDLVLTDSDYDALGPHGALLADLSNVDRDAVSSSDDASPPSVGVVREVAVLALDDLGHPYVLDFRPVTDEAGLILKAAPFVHVSRLTTTLPAAPGSESEVGR